MISEKVRELIAEISPEAVIFENPAFDNSIIGITSTGSVVYDLNLMIEELAQEDGISLEDAADFVDYNTLRSLSYAGSMAPVVVDRSLFEVEDD